MDGDGPDAPVFQVLHLVLHEGDERRDNESQSFLHHGRDLEADGFAAAGGEDGQDVVPRKGFPDDFFLHGTEVIVAPICLQYLVCRHACEGNDFFRNWPIVLSKIGINHNF